MRILLLEDEEDLAELVAGELRRHGLAVDIVAEIDSAEAALETTRYDALVLDRMVPDGDGLDLLTRLRRNQSTVPALFLTARDRLEDRVAGLNAGGDDYLLKPFAMPELVARVKALLRRPSGALGASLETGNLVFDTVNRELSVEGKRARIARRELALLEALMRRSGKVVPKSVLEESLYGNEEEVSANSVEASVSRLRKQLAEGGASVTIHTLRGVGYMLE